ncbi:MAG: histidinol-phosphate transaminase [Paracoccaceae bacterium]
MNNPRTPQPKSWICNPSLLRPDWTTGAVRNPDLLWLDKNENLDPQFTASNQIIVKNAVKKYLNIYPDSAMLYQKLGLWVGVSPKNLILTPGSDGAIKVVFEAFIQENDVVLHTSPTFAMYAVYCKIYGAQAITLEYAKSATGPKLEIEALLEAIKNHRPRLICLPNPDSPTGNYFGLSEMREIIETASLVGAIILVDEAYHPFYDVTVAGLVNTYPNLIVARSFAKAWGLAGLRIGYAVAGTDVTEYLHKIRPMYEVNSVAVAAIVQTLGKANLMQDSVNRLEAGKQFFIKEMRELGFQTLSGKGNFLHVAFAEKAPVIHSELSNIVLYRKDFNEPCLAGFSRFSSTTVELFKPIVDRIKHVKTHI